ncbi:hypothetical protein ZWY2020_031921 [Hordeum vulgare]|nr:hypothetical protein ZWY2020_031921 [Hordeum vulgare]
MANSRSSSSRFGFAAPPTSFSDQVLVPMASSGLFRNYFSDKRAGSRDFQTKEVVRLIQQPQQWLIRLVTGMYSGVAAWFSLGD